MSSARRLWVNSPIVLWLGLLAALLATAGPIEASQKKSPPNIVFIMIDDLGWADLPCYGNQFNETPNIDKLAAQSMKFTDYYTAGAVCSPTRASILSGQYQARFGLTAHIPGHWRPFEMLVEPPCALNMPLSIVTLAEALRAAGYVSGHVGKWHLGGKGHLPKDQGFDYSLVTTGRHVAPFFKTDPPMQLPAGKRLAEFLTDQAIDFMENNKDRPFFLHLSHYAVHIPLETTPELEKKYQAKKKVANYPCNPIYAGMIEEVDMSVGRIVAALEQLGLAENTILVFTSDNGGLVTRFDGLGGVITSNFPLRDEKGSLYEGGVRVPLLIRWPGRVPPQSVCREPAISVDFYRTFLEVSGAPAPKGQVLDGLSLMPLLKDPSATLNRKAIYWHYPHYHHSRPSGAIRAGDWKAIEFFDTWEIELYNLKDDIGESNNLAAKMPAKVKELRQLLHQWRQEVNAQMPQLNPAYDPKRVNEWWNRAKVAPKDAGKK